MPTATMTSKGQVTVPAEVRRELGLGHGSRITFERVEDGSYRVARVGRSIMELSGCLKYEGPPLTIEEMNEAIADAAVESYLESIR